MAISGELGHPDYTGITDERYVLRTTLREIIADTGFKPLDGGGGKRVVV